MAVQDMETIVSLAKKRGFVYPSSEIYGGFAAVYDFGPLGVELENNIKAAWWKEMVQKNTNVVGLDSSIFMNPKIWEASGHVSGFSDPLTECKECHTRHRVDHLLEEINVFADEKMSEEEINKLLSENAEKLACPKCGAHNFSEAKSFNLLVKSNLGNFTGDWDKEPVYLRGETCQGIFVNFKNVLDTTRQKVPFGIAQIGKAFRNEITARQFIFRTREFEQMELQYFVHPDDSASEFERWKQVRMDFYTNVLGVQKENLRWHEHENLVFYAKAAFDVEYKFPFGWGELEGVHARGDYDLTQHCQHSGQKLEYLDPATNDKYTPHVVETSAGVGRSLLTVLCDAYTEEDVQGASGKVDKRVVLKFAKEIAPFKIAVLPLSKKPELMEVAKPVWESLSKNWNVDYDVTQSIGRRYRRQDEIGTPYCVTVDFDSLEDKQVTVRDRDTMQQDRIAIDELENYFKERLG